MTWEEFVKKAKELGYDEQSIVVNDTVWISKKSLSFDLCFNNKGMVLLSGDEEYVLAEDKTPDQMYAIMEALK